MRREVMELRLRDRDGCGGDRDGGGGYFAWVVSE